MSPEQIREIVKITLDELTQRKLLNVDNVAYMTLLKLVSDQLTSYFNGESNDVFKALKQLSDDQYIDIIFLHYRDGKTLEWIAEYFEVDVSTIKRNKKRLIIKIAELLEL
jgi:RNA polymerase sigma factor (sigma-70 family)